MKLIATLVSFSVLACGCSGSGDAAPEPPAPLPPSEPPPPPLPPPPASGGYYGVDPNGSYDVRTTRAIVYTRALIDSNDPQPIDLHLDLFEPDIDLTGSEVPAVVMLHGGGFTKGTRNHGQIQKFGGEFARQGFIAVSIDYRLIPQDPVLGANAQDALDALGIPPSSDSFARAQLAAVEDTAASVGWLHETAAANDSRIDGVALLGASAGAVTVLNLAYVIDDLGIPRPAIAAVVALWGAMGLVYDPTLSVMSVDEAPVILVHGTADTVVDYETGSLRIANRAAQIGLPYELIANVGAGHSFSEMDLFVLETMPGSGVTQAQRIIDFIGVALLASDCLRQQGVIGACVLPDP
jgi:acetyl esterase/lipase